LFQALLLLQIDFVDVLAVGDVGGDLDAHGAPVHPADGAFMQVVPVAGQVCWISPSKSSQGRSSALRWLGSM
jgi:hypothetical protein